MKAKLFIIGIIIGFALNSYSQCSVSLQITNETCCGDCNGAMAATPMGGTAPYTYLWSPGNQTTATITMLCGGTTFTCTVTDALGNVCTNSGTVSCPMSMTVTPTDATCFTCCDGSATASATGGHPPYAYSWAGTTCGTGASASCTSICPGTYTVTVSDSTGCGTFRVYTINSPTGLHEFQNGDFVNIFPNPSSGIFTLSSKITNGEISISNLLGETIYKSEIRDPKSEIDLSDEANGIYFITIKTEKESFTQKIIISH